ncbi:MAG: ATP12 family chaperone protein [Sphingomicrobium sp.]
MKRFWTTATAEKEGDGWTIKVDDRIVRTPARQLLIAPTQALAEAISEEWRAVGDELDPRDIPLTGLANATIDRVAPDRQAFAAGLAQYVETDLACYRSEGPAELVRRQEQSWDKLLAWARRRYDVDFVTTSGLIHVAQPAATVERLSHAIASLDAFRLAGLSPLVTIGGSVVAALAVVEKAITAENAWDAVSIDERWQLEQWGNDAEAETALANRRRDFLVAARFLDLLDG